MSAATLTEVAGWDLPLLGWAVRTLDPVAGGLPAWRARVEAVGRSLEDASCWYGPAAQSAGAALGEVSTVATAVTAALEESLEHAQRLLTEAETAQELAERALAVAASVPVVLDGAGRLVSLPVAPVAEPGLGADQTAVALQAQELAEDALAAAMRAGHAAWGMADALTVLGAGGGLVPASFADLTARIVVVRSSAVPHVGESPSAVAQWWAGLSTAARAETIARTPYLVGGLEGLPAWARDEANRLHLERVLADPSAPGHAVAASVAAEMTRREADGEQVQLYQFQPQQQLVQLALGDVDTADSVALLVPGVTNDPVEDLDDLAHNAETVTEAASAASPGAAVASVVWLGYRPPGVLGAPMPGASRDGGRALDATLDGLATARAADPARVTLVAHSYGTTVVDRAADEPGPLKADNVVVLGSPGMMNDAAGLEVDEVYEASSPCDIISWGEWLGTPTWRDDFGATELPADWTTGHTEYFDEDRPTVDAIGEVVVGVR